MPGTMAPSSRTINCPSPYKSPDSWSASRSRLSSLHPRISTNRRSVPHLTAAPPPPSLPPSPCGPVWNPVQNRWWAPALGHAQGRSGTAQRRRGTFQTALALHYSMSPLDSMPLNHRFGAPQAPVRNRMGQPHGAGLRLLHICCVEGNRDSTNEGEWYERTGHFMCQHSAPTTGPRRTVKFPQCNTDSSPIQSEVSPTHHKVSRTTQSAEPPTQWKVPPPRGQPFLTHHKVSPPQHTVPPPFSITFQRTTKCPYRSLCTLHSSRCCKRFSQEGHCQRMSFVFRRQPRARRIRIAF